MKKIAAVFAAFLISLIAIAPTQAAEQSTVVIIDSGFDSQLLTNANIIQEVCVVSISKGCNNNTGFEEGPGAAGHNYKIRSRYVKDWNHGTQMADIVSQVNPNANIILLRNAKAIRGNVIAGNIRDFERALEWVAENTEKYNIVAVSFSRGDHSYAKKAASSGTSANDKRIAAYERVIAIYESRNYPESRLAPLRAALAKLKPSTPTVSALAPCPIDDSVRSDIVALQNLGVATVIASGNDGDKQYVDYPACIDEAVAVSTLAWYDNDNGTANAANNTNISDKTDFVVDSEFDTVFGRVVLSSSAATAALAGYWSSMDAGSFQATYDTIASNGYSTKDYSAVALNLVP
jgi:hypothetical protein